MFKSFLILVVVMFASAAFVGCSTIRGAHDSSASALYNEGVSLVNKGRYKQAKEIFHEYIAEYEDTHLYPVSLYYLGFCYQKLNDANQAVSIYHKVIDQSNDEFWTQMAKKRIQDIEGER